MTSPRVSVVMPVRNGARWLSPAIDSVLTQTLADLELIVIDDGSTDETPAIVAAYAQRDQRVRPLTQGPLGLVAALNDGLAQARGDLVARLDADDLARSERLATQVAAMAANPRLVVSGSWAEIVDAAGHTTGRLTPESDPQRLRKLLMRTNPFIHSSVMMRADAARQCGGYRAVFEAAEDYDLWLRLSERGDIAILPHVLISYRTHGGNVTARKAARQLFSTRLAAHAASARRESGIDPAAQLTSPPDWRTDTLASLAADLAVLRLLEMADPDIAESAALSTPALDAALRSTLSHRERKLAQAALLNLLARRDRPAGMSAPRLVAAMVRLHPPRAIKWLAQRAASH